MTAYWSKLSANVSDTTNDVVLCVDTHVHLYYEVVFGFPQLVVFARTPVTFWEQWTSVEGWIYTVALGNTPHRWGFTGLWWNTVTTNKLHSFQLVTVFTVISPLLQTLTTLATCFYTPAQTRFYQPTADMWQFSWTACLLWSLWSRGHFDTWHWLQNYEKAKKANTTIMESQTQFHNIPEHNPFCSINC